MPSPSWTHESWRLNRDRTYPTLLEDHQIKEGTDKYSMSPTQNVIHCKENPFQNRKYNIIKHSSILPLLATITCACILDHTILFLLTLSFLFKDFEALDNTERVSFVLGCELWTDNFDAMLALVKEHISNLWEVRKVKLHGEP